MKAPGTADGAAFAELTLQVSEALARLGAAREVQVGCSLKEAVWSCGKTTLYRYAPLVARSRSRPLLICFALVNRPYVLDLQPERSLVRRLLEAGLDVYLIDWGDPDDADRHIGLEEYIEAHLGGCIRHLRAQRGGERLDLLGVCQGGVLSLCYAALHPDAVANLITLTTPVDFHTPDNLLAKWVRGLDTALLERCGNVPGELLNGLFLALMPLRLTQQKYVRLLTSNPDDRTIEDFVRMEKWIFDSPAQSAAALAQFVRWFYQENRLVRDALTIGQPPREPAQDPHTAAQPLRARRPHRAGIRLHGAREPCRQSRLHRLRDRHRAHRNVREPCRRSCRSRPDHLLAERAQLRNAPGEALLQ